MNEEPTVECVDCGDDVDEDTTTTTGSGEVCEDCRDNYSTCEDCDDVTPNDDMVAVERGDKFVCDSCRDDNYYFCSDCEEYVASDDTTSTLHDESVCDSCISDNYGFCDDCDGYYHYDVGCGESHDENCDCESPAQRFAIRNGAGFLHNDTRENLSLPAGFISDEGIGAISRLIRDSAPAVDYDLAQTDREAYDAAVKVQQDWYRLAYSFADEIGCEWQTGQGNFTKRLSRYAYKSYAIKVTPAMLTEIGNIARVQSEGTEVAIEVTRDLNLSAEEFAHEDSCWWQSYSSSRCALKSNGGFGIRSFGTEEYPEYDHVPGPWALNEYSSSSSDPTSGMPTRWQATGKMNVNEGVVTGRAWAMPLRLVNGSFVPTFESETPDAYVVFNGYGDLSGYTATRILAGMVGMTYRKVSFSASPMYVNGDMAYLIAPESLAASYTDGRVNLDTPQHATLHSTERAHAHV